MANIRYLKKDINFLMEEVIETCFLHYHLRGETPEKREEIDQIIDEIIVTRNNLIQKINNPEVDGKKGPGKKFYNEILNEMMQKADEAFEKLGVAEK
ncbi:MAG: hypothetical protein K0B37_01615 [Bacteroidales bacterium]|nr:hypothetical protein [Bacteroidales bacterium]